jgi:UDP-N-acetylmuramoylalanine--D-glutamate ligase
MLVVYGKGKVGKWLDALLTHLDIVHFCMDDDDRDDVILSDAKYIVMSPGITPKHSIYQKYSKKILSELSYLGRLLSTLSLPKITFIGITGTNGKSTTSWIMYQALQKLFPDAGVWLTWNFDVPLSQTLLSIMQESSSRSHFCVIEASSFMLYNLDVFMFDYSIFLNIARDHMDWHEDMQDYFFAKSRICAQTKKSFVGHTINVLLPASLQKKATIIPQYIDIAHTQFVGKHNMHNMAAVSKCLEVLCKDVAIVFNPIVVFERIQPLPHRLQLIREVDGVAIIDDGISTSAQSLLAALDAIDHPCVAIVWWHDKGDDYTILHTAIRQKVACLVCIGETKYLFADIAKHADIPYIISDTLTHAVHTAIDYARRLSVQTVLFSPGAASFDMFVNVYDRVNQFNHIVQSL